MIVAGLAVLLAKGVETSFDAEAVGFELAALMEVAGLDDELADIVVFEGDTDLVDEPGLGVVG